MDKKFENKIIQSLRYLSFSYPPRSNAKKKCKVGACLYRCEKCAQLVYEGKSEKNYNKFVEEYDESVVFEKFQMDHIIPVIKPGEGKKTCATFGEYIARFVDGLFVPEEGFQGFCRSCHTAKSKSENLKRTEFNNKEKSN